MIRLLYIFLLLWSAGISAQFSLTGVVMDENNRPITDAEILVEPNQQFVGVDNKGAYRIQLEEGKHFLTVYSYSFSTRSIEVEIRSDQQLDIILEPLGAKLSEVEIMARREALFGLKRMASVEGTSIYSGKKSEVVLLGQHATNLVSNNPRQIYAQVVGLNIYEGNDAGLQLNIGGRGLDPNRTANFNTRQNGYDISADVLGYPESYYTPPAEALDEIQVVRGAAALQYGTQFGGLVNFIMKRAPKRKLEVKLRNAIGSNGLINNFLSAGGQQNGWEYSGYFQYKQGDGFRPNSDFSSKNAYARISHKWANGIKLSGEYTHLDYIAQQPGGLTDTQFSDDIYQSNRARNYFSVDWNLAALKMEHKINDQWLYDIQLSGLIASRKAVGWRGNPIELNQNPITALDEQDVNGEYVLPRDLIDGRFKNYTVEAKVVRKGNIASQKVTSLLGAKWYLANNKGIQGPGSKKDDADFELYTSEFPDYASQSDFTFPNKNLALFTEHVWHLTDKLEITPGARFEWIKTESKGTYNQVTFDIAGNPIGNKLRSDNRTLDRVFVLMGLGLSYAWSPKVQLYTNISQNYRSVTFSDIRVVSPTFIVDENISDEKGFTLDGGLRGQWGEAINFDVGAFAIKYNDRIGIKLDNRANRVRKNIGDAIIYGAEIFTDINLLALWKGNTDRYRLNLFSNLALTKSEYLRSEENNVVGKQVEFIPAANLKSGIRGGYRNWLLSLQYTYLSEQYTDVENSQAAPVSDSRHGIIGPIYAYDVWDLSMSYRYGLLKVEAGVNNFLDEAYFTRRATGYPGPGIIPSDPRAWYLGVELTF